MNLFKRKSSYVKIGRAILKLQEIKDIIMVLAPGEGKETATAPFKLKVDMKYASDIQIEFLTWDERQECFDKLWDLLREL